MEMNKYSPANLAKCIVLLLYASLCLNCFSGFCSFAQLLPEEEVKVLQAISSKLQIKDWNNVSRASCRDGVGLNGTYVDKEIFSNVTCDCSFSNNSVCHVTRIELMRLNLIGVLPTEFANLSHLTVLDVTRSYLNGTIPANFGQLPLKILSLLGNGISGMIPREIGDITTLEELVLENNLLGGPLPESLGRLSHLRRLVLSANNFTGEIPESFSNLKNLTDLRLDGNSLSGRIPDFIGNWTSMKRLDMQGASLEGPIPSTIGQLKNLTDLRISGLNISTMGFPNLADVKNIRRLILRSCSITGQIPNYIGEMQNLRTLDLSFNKLNGPIPLQTDREQLQHLLLSDNMLAGEIPEWIIKSTKSIDVSYNNFTNQSYSISCSDRSVNIVSSYSTSSSNLKQYWCSMKDLPCSSKPEYYSLFINCGGPRINFGGNEYEADETPGQASYFFVSPQQNWAYSSSGVFMGREEAPYKESNSPSLNVTGAEFYRTARLAPGSLKYYGLCLRKGSYRVRLHFAEIMYTNDMSFSSLGRRIFDVAIQGRVVLKDFNIVEEANGAGIGITKEFNDVLVNGSTLEIHLYWTGKGTNAIPDKGVYGPLISAITVTPS